MLTFWMRFFRFVSFLSAAFPSKAVFTLALTFCRKDATNLTFTSDSSNAAVISLRVASRSFSGVQSIDFVRSETEKTDFFIDHWGSIERRKCCIESPPQIGEDHTSAGPSNKEYSSK